MNAALLYELLKEQTFQGIARNGPLPLPGQDITPLLDEECALLARHSQTSPPATSGGVIGVDVMRRHVEYTAAAAARRGGGGGSSLWKTMRDENAQYGIVYVYDAEHKRLRRNATTKTLEVVTRAQHDDVVRVFYTKEEAGVWVVQRTVRDRVFGGENGTIEYVFFYTHTSDRLYENGYAVIEALSRQRQRYRVDYRNTAPYAQLLLDTTSSSGAAAGGYATLAYGDVADDAGVIEIQSTAAIALPADAVRFDLRHQRCGFVLATPSVKTTLTLFFRDGAPLAYDVRFKPNDELFTMSDGTCVLRCAFAEPTAMNGVIVVATRINRDAFTLAPFYAMLAAEGGGEGATPALIHHLIEHGMSQYDVDEFTNHGAAAHLLPLLPLARNVDEASDPALLAMRELDAALVEFVATRGAVHHQGAAHARLLGGIQRAQLTPGADAYVERVEAWLNAPATGFVESVSVTQVSITCTPRKFADDAVLSLNTRHVHKNYEVKNFEPLFVITSAATAADVS